MMPAKQLLIADVTVSAFISRMIRYAKYIQTKDESCLFDLRRFIKRWWGISREKTVIASSLLVTIKGANFLPLIFTLLVFIIHAHIISFVINMKYKNYGTWNRSCSFGLPTYIFP
jgi:hypothetical protein